ncbi:MAG: hypothetical protein E6H07_18840 [Bacteroidetes bacterium]|nr:MAG: hypothetical protein E6H07_18840 [Bacteroidota bacterium]
MKKSTLLIVILCVVSGSLFSQDKIYRNNGKIVLAKVIEVGATEIKYKEFDNPDGPIYVLEADRILKIVYENGKVEKFTDNLKDPERYAGQSNRAIKINFLSPLYGYFELGYEKSVSLGKSYEFSLGIIGAGKNSTIDYYSGTIEEVKKSPFGFFISGGYKFGRLPDFLIFGKSKASHLMQGTYVKPIVYFGNYKENIIMEKANSTYEVGEQNVTFGALQIEFGRQWVLGEKMVMDLYWGFGYGIDNKEDSYQYYSSQPYYENTSAFNYAYARGGSSPGLALSFGLKMGLLLKNKEAK